MWDFDVGDGRTKGRPHRNTVNLYVNIKTNMNKIAFNTSNNVLNIFDN